MTRDKLRDLLETRQIAIYFAAVLLGALVGALIPGSGPEHLVVVSSFSI